MTAADDALAAVALVRDSPTGRRELVSRTYADESLTARHLSFRRAELAFMDWQLRRGALAPPDAPRPGSPWWRACNERLLRDGCEAVSGLRAGAAPPSSATIGPWRDFLERPSASSWYRAHNASIVAAYLEHHALARDENPVERFFLNVVLLRVLYAHALVAAPALALGRLTALAPALGDPRVRMTGLFLALSRVLPDSYPAEMDLQFNIRAERHVARLLDYGIIGPRLQAVYEWSADVLGEPGLLALIDAGSPCYELDVMREVWQPSRPRASVRLVRRLLPAPR